MGLLYAKSKITSLKSRETIPRLELLASAMGVAIAVMICKAIRYPMCWVHFKTDSMTVLYWLHGTEALTSYVGSRISQILERTSIEQWAHIRADQNPADVPTRPIRPSKLRDSMIWWSGPDS